MVIAFVYLLVFKFRGQKLPFQTRIEDMTRKEALVDSSLIYGIPTAEQLRERDYEKRRLELENKERENDKESQIITAKKDSLLEIKRTLEMLIGQREQAAQDRIKKLAKVYEGMRAEEAAPIISELDDQTIVDVFLQMNERRVARILGVMPVDRATEIAQRLTTYGY